MLAAHVSMLVCSDCIFHPLTIYMDAIIEDMKTGGTMVGEGVGG